MTDTAAGARAVLECVYLREESLERPGWVTLATAGSWFEICAQFPAPSLDDGSAMLALQAVFDVAVQESIRAGTLPDAAPALVAALSRRLAEQIGKSDADPGRT